MIKCSDAIKPIRATLCRNSCAHYPDPGAAADWLSMAFWPSPSVSASPSPRQMKAGDGCFTIAEGNVIPNNSHIVQVRIEDAKGHCERARQNGAIILTEPQDQPYGERQLQRAGLLRPPLGLYGDHHR